MEVFANKVSGAKQIEEREDILSLLKYVSEQEVKRVVCLEISRLGRNTLEALKVIQLLNEHGVSLYVKNYNLETLNPDGKVNPVASLICTILLEIASMERLTIKERTTTAPGRAIPIRFMRPFQTVWTFRSSLPAEQEAWKI